MCKKELEKYRMDGIFTPPSLEGSISYLGTSGGMNWGSAAVDPQRGVLITTQSHLVWVTQLLERAAADALDPAEYGFPKSLYPMEGTPYGAIRFLLMSALGTPCAPKPWESITAVDLKSGEVLCRNHWVQHVTLRHFPYALE